MNSYEVVSAYVKLHNEGVRSRDFGPMLALFDDRAEMEFPIIDFGPFVGRMEIGEAFAKHGPSDELVTLNVAMNDETVILTYAWAHQPEHQAGEIHATVHAGKIVKIVIYTRED
jgi:hypothetical protein